MYRRTVYKVVCPESRKRIALQCVDLLRPSATPAQRTRIANRILAMCDSKVVWTEEGRKPRRMTPDLLSELIAIHAQCVLDQDGKCTLTVFVQPLAWEINQAMGLADETDKAFRRVDPMCAARPLSAERFDLSEDRLLDAVYNILQINRALLKDGHLEHEDHKAYFTQHVAILKELMGRDKVVQPGGIAQSPDGKLWRVVEVDNEKVILKKVRGWKRIEITWQEGSRGWGLKFP